MLSLDQLRLQNERAAMKELREMRADCIAHLATAYSKEGNAGIRALLVEAIPAWGALAIGVTEASA